MIAILAFNPIWITLGPIVVINGVLIVSYCIYQIWMRKLKKREFGGAKTGGSQILGSNTREWWFWTTDPIVRLFVRMKLGPNAITAMGFALSLVAALLFALGLFGYGGWMMMLGASFDMFDGRVARITGKSSRSGAFFDAVMDRFGEGACLMGLGYYFRDSWMLIIVFVALIGSLLVSYTKARAEGIGAECNVGIMQRPERIVYLGVASIFDPIMSTILNNYFTAPPPILMMLALIVIALMTTGTAIYRMIYVMNALDTKDKRGKESIPQIITRLSTPKGREEFWAKARFGYDRSKAQFSHVVLFVAGGLRPETLSLFAKRGDLPNISKYILERGSDAVATSVFPSTTGIGSIPFVTGCFPGTCNIPGVRWFDRSVPSTRVLTINRFRDYIGWGAYAMDFDLSKNTRTIFEYSKQAVNIFGMLNRGCGLVRDPAFFSMHSRFHRAHKNVDVEVAEEAAFQWFKSAIKRETDFVLYAFPPLEGADAQGTKPELVSHSYKNIDDYIGRAAKLLKDNGMYDKTILMLAGTHGQSTHSHTFDLKTFLSRRYKTCIKGSELRAWQVADIIALCSGTSQAHLYIKEKGSWDARPFIEDVERRGLVGSMLEEDGVDLIAGRSVDGGIIVQSRRGRAHILEDADGRITYRVKGTDPFGYGPINQVINSDEAFNQTCKTNYPDGLIQITQLFRSKRCGDIVISANADTSLMQLETSDKPMPTHGSLASEHMLVPIITSEPIDSQMMRTTDVFATILEKFMGIEPEHNMDGFARGLQQVSQGSQINTLAK